MIKKVLFISALLFSMGFMVAYKATIVQETNTSRHIVDENQYDPIVVLELFKSQGCSSCPPADLLLEQVKKDHPNNLFALSYHVDYWNYIGWNDPFSHSAYTKKQREYNIKFKSSSNYTPQMVVNGKEHFVGSNASKMASMLEKYQKLKTDNHLKIVDLERKNTEIDFSFEVKGAINNRLLRAVVVLDERTTFVKRGENRNKKLKNANIVIAEKYFTLDSNSGHGMLEIPNNIQYSDKLQLILLVEHTNLDITAAAKRRL